MNPTFSRRDSVNEKICYHLVFCITNKTVAYHDNYFLDVQKK